MKKYVVLYRDYTFSLRNEVFKTQPMDGPRATEMGRMLEHMGCHDIEFQPVKDASQETA